MPDPSSPSPADDLTAELERIAKRAQAGEFPLKRKPYLIAEAVANDVPRLLGAIEAVLKLAEGWATERPGEVGLGYNATRACGRSVREAITRELTGKEAGSDG